VAEHLPEDSAKSFVAALVGAAPVILFSVAIPNQGGTHHVNERWQSYWAALFAEHGYIALDCVRPAVFGDQRVELWYRQNILMFCLPGRCPSGYMAVRSPYYLDRVDPELFTRVANGPPYSGREALHMLPRIPSVLTRAIIRKIRARL
jgi:hypothetical protein